jgi:hypothetical protein
MIIKTIDNILDNVKRPIYLGSVFTLECIYVLIFFKFINYTPTVVLYVNYFIQAFISIFLILKFHPFRKHEIKEFDSTIICGSAIFLLANIGFTEYMKHYFETAAKKADGEIKKFETK